MMEAAAAAAAAVEAVAAAATVVVAVATAAAVVVMVVVVATAAVVAAVGTSTHATMMGQRRWTWERSTTCSAPELPRGWTGTMKKQTGFGISWSRASAFGASSILYRMLVQSGFHVAPQ